MSQVTVLQPGSRLIAFLRRPINWLFAFIPITLILEHGGHASPPLVFFSAALAIVPIAALIVHATEQIATRTGDAIGGRRAHRPRRTP